MAQSQPLSFIQNKKNELFIGTIGGLSRFDGTHFKNYTRSNGLPHNLILSLGIDTLQNIFIGTLNGLGKFNGKTFKTIDSPPKKKEIQQVVVDKTNQVWALSNGKLLRLKNEQLVVEHPDKTTISVTLDKSGQLWAFNYLSGVSVWNGKDWHKEIDIRDVKGFVIYKMTFGNYSGNLFALTSDGVKVTHQGKLTEPEFLSSFPGNATINSICEDSYGNIWITTEKGGAWFYNNKKWIYFNEENGFVNEKINAIFEDNEKNIWLASNGLGIFRFTGIDFTYYDRSSGLSSSSIMSITENSQSDLFLLGSNHSIFKLKNNQLSKLTQPKKEFNINTIYIDSKNEFLLGTDHGLWIYNDGQVEKIIKDNNAFIYGIYQIKEIEESIWISANNGLFRYRNGKGKREKFPYAASYAEKIGEDSLLVGTFNGAYIYNYKTGKVSPEAFVKDVSVLTILSDHQRIYIGTDEKGLVIWDKISKNFTTLNANDGLSCNYIYSILKDQNGNIWVGTGCGINRISYNSADRYTIDNLEQSNGINGLESNANAILEDRQGNIWFGTNRALFKYNPYLKNKTLLKENTQVIFQSVQLFSNEIGGFSDSTLPFSDIPYNPFFTKSQNHLSFSFIGISLTHPDKIKYRYFLEGIDKDPTKTQQNTVVYPNLPPGNYVFKVWASNSSGDWSTEPALYPFTINTPFYTTLFFKIGIGLLLIALFLGLVYYRNIKKAEKIKWANQLREEEQSRVRQKTAEDFHDEIGNKLTRIKLLATIAESKIAQPSPDVASLLGQIKDNVQQLYKGSKDIIWSLQPQSDYLNEILLKIKQNTSELLESSSIKFDFILPEDLETKVKLPIDYSRNIIMIYKEAVNNIVKHAQADYIRLEVRKNENEIEILLKDNGKGFDEENQDVGNGLINMKNRAKRIKGNLEIKSNPGLGTTIQLRFPV